MSKIIFFGNQKLVQGIKTDVTTITDALQQSGHEIIATITTKKDLTTLSNILSQHPDAIAVLASFGSIAPETVLNLFEPIGILNIHPSLLPKYRGSTPIESAILNGDQQTGVSIMKLSKAMDAGPLYAQQSISISKNDNKFTLCAKLTALGSQMLIDLLKNIVNFTTQPIPQDETNATYTQKLDKSMSKLQPSTKTAQQLDQQVRAFLNFPKSKYTFQNVECTILKTHPAPAPATQLDLKCADGNYLVIDQLLPANSKPMSAKDFLNGLKSDLSPPLSPLSIP